MLHSNGLHKKWASPKSFPFGRLHAEAWRKTFFFCVFYLLPLWQTGRGKSERSKLLRYNEMGHFLGPPSFFFVRGFGSVARASDHPKNISLAVLLELFVDCFVFFCHFAMWIRSGMVSYCSTPRQNKPAQEHSCRRGTGCRSRE